MHIFHYCKRTLVLPFVAFLAMLIPGKVMSQEVNTDTLMKHIIELSSERYEGRQAGTYGYNAAVKYCVEVLSSYGVEPAGEDGGWLQEFDVECNEIDNCTFHTYLPGAPSFEAAGDKKN